MECRALFFAIILFFIGCKQDKLFVAVDSNHSEIHFNNAITENDSINPLDLPNMYNGGGVGIGDFNNDGLADIYFTGNEVPCKMYINNGDFKFEDVTESAGVNGNGRWCKGVSVVDVNQDGLADLYICGSLVKDPRKRENILYVNEGIDKQGIPHFANKAAEYGLNDTLHSTMASFFDYDNDGDLDMYLTVNEIPAGENPSMFRATITNGSYPSTGRLYRNELSDSLKHSFFRDVSKQAGITIEGYGHAATISDINLDGWKDIYVSNDFIGSDILYINHTNGTFSDQSKVYFKHTAANGMGQDIQDINNDGLADVVELDMNPEDNYRKKMMMNGSNYPYYQLLQNYGYQYQYVRNVLQVNMGPRMYQNDSVGPPVFAEASFMSGISQTDWSWTPMVADFDNNGFRDIIITNGYPKDVTDHDFTAFRQKANNLAAKDYLLAQIPEVKIKNYAFSNNGNLDFRNVSESWGITKPSFSNGAAYADFDNDGDLDYVVNNINDEAFLFENKSSDNKDLQRHFLQVKFSAEAPNRNGLGAFIELHYNNGIQQVYENNPYRGYLSTIQDGAHFGLGNIAEIDSLIVKWPDGKMQLLQHVKANQSLTVKHSDANLSFQWNQPAIADNALFKQIGDSVHASVLHQENDYIDFNTQRLLPHKLSDYGPALAVGDINGDGLDDMVMSASPGYNVQIMQQQKTGTFRTTNLRLDSGAVNPSKNMGLLLFDADNDEDLDLYIANGGTQSVANSANYTDWLYINNGKGIFTLAHNALPQNLISKSCVKATDFDHDGDLDLFIGGRCNPGRYPQPVNSFIYRNDSKNDDIKFSDVTDKVAKELNNIGLVCDALWTDFDNDGWMDLIIVGEWMPIKCFKNNKGVLEPQEQSPQLQNAYGWWNSIVSGDFDNDGLTDYIVGNLGENSYYKGSDQYPLRLYAKDFDKNGRYDIISTRYLENIGGKFDEFPAQTRDDIVDALPVLKKKFLTYNSFATATFKDIFNSSELKDALALEANYFQSSCLHNLGNGKFEMSPLPKLAQISPLYGMVAEDFDGDGNLDVAITGNDFGTEVSVGKYDALNGLLLKGDGKGNFKSLTIRESGIFIPGFGQALVALRNPSGKLMLAASQNRDTLKVFALKRDEHTIAVEPTDVSALIKFNDGRIQRKEFYYGTSYLSQSARLCAVPGNVKSVTIFDSKNTSRVVDF